MTRRDGFVLVAALWLLVALSAVGLDAALRSRTRRLAAANMLDEARARAAALSATELAWSRLTAATFGRVDQLREEVLQRNRAAGRRLTARGVDVRGLFRQADPGDDPWRAPQELVDPVVNVGDVNTRLTIRDAGAALNLNEADETMLRQFFAQGLRVDYAKAERLTQAILDWRDQDELPRIGGGEREQYLQEGAAVLPPNRPFADIDELRHVMGMTPELFDEAAPYLILIGSGRINVNAAPEPVLLALPGMTPPAVTELLRLRRAGRFPRTERQLRELLPAASANTLTDNRQAFARRASFATTEVEIVALAATPGSPIRVRAQTVITRTSTGSAMVWRNVE